MVVTTKSSSKDENNKSKKKRPALTIKIENSSFNDNEEEDAELASEFEKSPNIYISGITCDFFWIWNKKSLPNSYSNIYNP